MERWRNVKLQFRAGRTQLNTPLPPSDDPGRTVEDPTAWASMRVIDGVPPESHGTTLGSGGLENQQTYRFRFLDEGYAPAVGGLVTLHKDESLTPLWNRLSNQLNINSVKPVYGANGLRVVAWEIECSAEGRL